MKLISDAGLLQIRTAALANRGEAVIYRERTQTTDMRSGEITETHVNTPLTALVSAVSTTEEGRIRRFRIIASHLGKTPVRASIVVFENRDYLVFDWMASQASTVYDLICKAP